MNNMNKTKKNTELLHMKRVDWITGTRVRSQRNRKLPPGRFHSAMPKQYTERSASTESSLASFGASRRSMARGGFLQSVMCPKANQVFLAFSTLLFFFSFEFLILGLMHINPAIVGQQFTETECSVVHTYYNGNITCYVDSISNHGEPRKIPCLQIYVKPVAIGRVPSNRTRQVASVTDSPKHGQQSSQARNQLETESPFRGDLDAYNDSDNDSVMLIYEDERNYAGLDYLYRRCSYIPDFCDNEAQLMYSDIYKFACQYGKMNSVIKCYYDHTGKRVILNKAIPYSTMLNLVLWPLAGTVVSIALCIGFWNRNHKRVSRLYVYNSWSAS